jgi:hypothetical protein
MDFHASLTCLASVPAPTVSQICSESVSGKNPYLLRLLAKTFEFELEWERQLQLKGAATLPPEWAAHLERERQQILDQIQRMEEDSTSPFDTAQVPVYSSHMYLLPTSHMQKMMCTISHMIFRV